MHKNLPSLFIFLDQYNNRIFENNNINLGVIYRNYNDPKREKELTKVAKACKKNRYQFFVANDIKLAFKVRADGIYIPAFNKTKRFYNLEKKYREVLLNSIENFWSDKNQNKLKLQRETINATYSWDVRSIEWKNFFNKARELKA